jgi:hypothetical protein
MLYRICLASAIGLVTILASNNVPLGLLAGVGILLAFDGKFFLNSAKPRN